MKQQAEKDVRRLVRCASVGKIFEYVCVRNSPGSAIASTATNWSGRCRGGGGGHRFDACCTSVLWYYTFYSEPNQFSVVLRSGHSVTAIYTACFLVVIFSV